MRARQIAVVVALVTFGIAGVAVPAVADIATQTQEETDGLGAEMTSFAQSTAADTSSSVDQGMWEVALNQSDRPEEELENRVTELEQRLVRLQNRSQELSAAENGTPGYTARAAAVRVEIANIQSAIEGVNRSANERGVEIEKLDKLRSEAGNMTGPEVRDLVRNMTDTPGGPGVNPGQSGDNPGNSGDNPGQSDDNPGNSDDNPGRSGDNPGQSDDNSGNSDSNTDQSDDKTDNSGDNTSGSDSGGSNKYTQPGQS